MINQKNKIEIVYEDDSLIVINKPKNILVHPTTFNEDETIVGLLKDSIKKDPTELTLTVDDINIATTILEQNKQMNNGNNGNHYGNDKDEGISDLSEVTMIRLTLKNLMIKFVLVLFKDWIKIQQG